MDHTEVERESGDHPDPNNEYWPFLFDSIFSFENLVGNCVLFYNITCNLLAGRKIRSMMIIRFLKEFCQGKAFIQIKVVYNLRALKRKIASTSGVTIIGAPLGRMKSHSTPSIFVNSSYKWYKFMNC